MAMKAPFEPTNCKCSEDKANCNTQPGHLLPGQLREICEFLKIAIEDAARFFWNSPGMLLSRAGELFRIRTITPRFKDGKCVFYENGLCKIHAAAPFGCRYFDVHMDKKTANERARWGVYQIIDRREEYEAERDRLPEATHYRPRSAV